MTSKEQTIRRVECLKEKAEQEKKENGRISFFSRLELEYFEEVLKGLEELEEIKNLMGTPIQDIMKRLKILEILKRAVIEDELFKLDDDGYGNCHKYILVDFDNYHASSITSEEYQLLKEWLDNEKGTN